MPKVSNRSCGSKFSLSQLKTNCIIFLSYSSRLEQVEDRILGLEDKIDVKEKTEGYSEKRLRN
jgi:hypothetical protein